MLREVVRMIARRLDIIGHVGYLEPFHAEIVAEGEQENLKEFIGLSRFIELLEIFK